MDVGLQGRVAVVTGAARVIGRATALEPARPGASVAVDPHTWSGGADEVVRVARALGADALAVQTDVADPGTVERLIGTAPERWGRIDVPIDHAARRPTAAGERRRRPPEPVSRAAKE